jgi:hypothetical protein
MIPTELKTEARKAALLRHVKRCSDVVFRQKDQLVVHEALACMVAAFLHEDGVDPEIVFAEFSEHVIDHLTRLPHL